MKRFLISLGLFAVVSTALCCFQMTGTKLNGKKFETQDNFTAHELESAMKENPRVTGTKMEAGLRDRKDFEGRSDYAVALMFQGRGKEAIEIFESLEKEKPGQYVIAANLGTSYELSGNNEQALHWIQEGIHRNPNSHRGTEWLHVKILEAKIAQQKDADYFKKHSVLNLQAEKIGRKIQIDDQQFSPGKVAEAINYQLQERMQFVKPPDAPVASLLFDYAAIEAATNTLESANEILDLAVQYGYPKDQVEPLLKLYKERIGVNKRAKSN